LRKKPRHKLTKNGERKVHIQKEEVDDQQKKIVVRSIVVGGKKKLKGFLYCVKDPQKPELIRKTRPQTTIKHISKEIRKGGGVPTSVQVKKGVTFFSKYDTGRSLGKGISWQAPANN